MSSLCTARVRQHSPVWNLWHAHARVGGVVQGVVFTWEPGNVYRSAALSVDQATLLAGHASIALETVDEAPGEAVEAPAVAVEADEVAEAVTDGPDVPAEAEVAATVVEVPARPMRPMRR